MRERERERERRREREREREREKERDGERAIYIYIFMHMYTHLRHVSAAGIKCFYFYICDDCARSLYGILGVNVLLGYQLSGFPGS